MDYNEHIFEEAQEFFSSLLSREEFEKLSDNEQDLYKAKIRNDYIYYSTFIYARNRAYAKEYAKSFTELYTDLFAQTQSSAKGISYDEAYAEVLEECKIKAKPVIARHLLDKNISLDIIEQTTGLSRSEIVRL